MNYSCLEIPNLLVKYEVKFLEFFIDFNLNMCFSQVKYKDEALECFASDTGTERRANCALTFCLKLLFPSSDILVDKSFTL